MADIVSFRSSRSRRQQALPSPPFWRRSRFQPSRYAGFFALLVTLAVAAYAFEPWKWQTATLSGDFVTVIDGDTIRIRNERIRLIGIDAPEIHQTCRDASDHNWSCGRVARDRLVELVSASKVRCGVRGHDKYGRTLAACTSSSGDDLGETLVREGHAVAYGDYRLTELAARVNNRGLWSGDFERPHIWRKTHRNW